MGKFRLAIGRAFARVADMLVPSGWQFFSYQDKDGKIKTIERSDVRESYYSNAFRACLLAKARPLSSLPVHVYERQDGARVESNRRFARRLSRLLQHRWNPLVTASEGIRWLMMTKDTLGEAFVRVEYDGSGMPVALWPMSGSPQVEFTGNGPVFRYGGDRMTKPGVYLSNEILWVKSPILDSDCIHGVSLAELAARELHLSINLETFYENVLNGSGTFAGWLETDQKLNPQDIDQIVQQLSDGGGIVGAGRVRVFDKGLSYKSNDQTMVDMNLVEQEKWILQQTCRTLSVPPQEVFDLSHATYSNIEQGAINFANKTLVPECKALEEAFSGILWAAGYDSCYVQFDLNGLMRGSYKERMDGYRIAIYAGIYSPNDVRTKEDMPAYEGGQYYLRSTAYAAVNPDTGEAIQAPSSGTLPGGSGEAERDDGTGDGDVSPDARGTALAIIHDDMARRIKERYQDHGDTERFRDFARRVLTPIADAYEVDGIEYSIEDDIEEIIHG